MFKVGDWVVLAALPEWVSRLPAESQAVFRFCLGRAYRVAEITEHGFLVLDVSIDVDKVLGGYMNDIRVETDYVTRSVPR